ncbi:MAG: HAD family hydrolase [Hyphomicrobiales bacterium]|nr:HAD family hydrolase [Hyphomicrobiales bacterium]
MYFIALVTDYDGTLAADGQVDAATVEALRRFKESGRKLILATGRELSDLQAVFSELDVFDLVVAENGALIHLPATGEERAISPSPDLVFVERLRELGVEPLSVGHSIVATWEPNETTVLEVIRDLGLDLQLTFNKGAVMVLPAGVNKGSGVKAALEQLAISPRNAVGVGDAENDEAFLRLCGRSVAVANALPAVKKGADHVTKGARGEGVRELIDLMLESETAILPVGGKRQPLVIAKDLEGKPIVLEELSGSILIAGTSGSGKSTLATSILEHIAEAQFQFCILDPEGDYSEFEGAVVVGDAEVTPSEKHTLELLAHPSTNVTVNLLSLPLADRPIFFAGLLGKIAEMRATSGRPHWLLIDEAHHMLPRGRSDLSQILPQELPSSLLVTVHPDAVSRDALRLIDMVLGVGDTGKDVVSSFCRALGEPSPEMAGSSPTVGQAVFWRRSSGTPPRLVSFELPKRELQRHKRKYAKGDLGEDKSFYFRGPNGQLNLRAQNLSLFLQLADGVDDETFAYHAERRDYSAWFRESIKDEELARAVAEIESSDEEDLRKKRAEIRVAVESRYTAPATPA